MKVSFQLTMPNVGSWNGKWTGADRKYYVVRSFRGREATKLLETLFKGDTKKGFHYSFGDGWGANVCCERVDEREARKRTRESAGFCSYEWMIDSILAHGEILNTLQRKELVK